MESNPFFIYEVYDMLTCLFGSALALIWPWGPKAQANCLFWWLVNTFREGLQEAAAKAPEEKKQEA